MSDIKEVLNKYDTLVQFTSEEVEHLKFILKEYNDKWYERIYYKHNNASEYATKIEANLLLQRTNAIMQKLIFPLEEIEILKNIVNAFIKERGTL